MISFSARICMRCCSAAIRSLVTCWIKAITPTVKMANTPRIRLLRSIERLGVRNLSMSFHLAQAALGLAVAIGAGYGVVIDGRGAEVHQQHSKGDRIGIVAPHAYDIHQNADSGSKQQATTGAGRTTDRVGDDEEGTEHGRAAEQMEQRRT